MDLVCTREFLLYKSSQVCSKCAIRLLVTLFVITCYCLDTQQAWSNATKCKQEKMTFADEPHKIRGQHPSYDCPIERAKPPTHVEQGQAKGLSIYMKTRPD